MIKQIEDVEMSLELNTDKLPTVRFDPDKHTDICTAALETYAFARREAVVIDAITAVAAVEYMDRSVKRPGLGWRRELSVVIPVYDLATWKQPEVLSSLHDAVSFLTGDTWQITFCQRAGSPLPKPQDTLPLPNETASVIVYSDGLDSRAVASLIDARSPSQLLRVRVGSRAIAGESRAGKAVPFTGIPYQLRIEGRKAESSARSRGFKFATFAGIAAYLADAHEVIVPESGQGIFGPAMIPVFHSYADYRNHPLFTARVERFLQALLGHTVKFAFPRLWNTKAETLREYVSSLNVTDWRETRSCWQDSRWCSFDGKRRQCGICAACILRRMSVFAAGLSEPDEAFLCERLAAGTLEESLVPGFRHFGKSFEEYAIAGVLQLDHFAGLQNNGRSIAVHSHLVSQALSKSYEEIQSGLTALIQNHSCEWHIFVDQQGSESFLRDWTVSR